jgi:hypothetical protein
VTDHDSSSTFTFVLATSFQSLLPFSELAHLWHSSHDDPPYLKKFCILTHEHSPKSSTPHAQGFYDAISTEGIDNVPSSANFQVLVTSIGHDDEGTKKGKVGSHREKKKRNC